MSDGKNTRPLRRTAAIVLAAGSGTRMHTATKKQFLELQGKPVLWFSLKLFDEAAINDIILVGGSSKIPKIREILLKIFDTDKIRDKINQDEEVVIGATWKSHYLAKKLKNLKVLDILSHSLGVGSINRNREERRLGLAMSVLIPKELNFQHIQKLKNIKQ